MKRTGSEQSGGAIQLSAAGAAPNSANSARVQPSAAGKSKLVFGLGSKTNRLKHDEYAEKRLATPPSASGSETKQSSTRINRYSSKPIDCRETSPLRRRKSLDRKEELTSAGRTNDTSETKAEKQQIRASKYGNFYKPQDLVVNKTQAVVSRPAIESQSTKRSSSIERKQQQAAAEPLNQRSKSPARVRTPADQRSLDTVESAQVKKRSQLATSTLGRGDQSVQCGVKMKEANSLPSVSPANNGATMTKPAQPSETAPAAEKQPVESEKQLLISGRTQFSIPLPPQMSSILGKGSVVSYAKSRIYDKPARQSILQHGNGSSLLDSGAIPASISSGFKPPKQVNVSKARERWEGGEPFAKCKSKQRLARQAGKRLIPGSWSMSSVVATQQMQLQQVMSNANQVAGGGLNRQDPSVKILTRGSVLERVQQFERVPLSTSSTGDSSSGSSDSSSSSSPSSPDDFLAEDRFLQHKSQPATEASLASSQPLEPVELRAKGVATGTCSKQAQYKNRVSSIQISNDSQPIFSPKSPQSPPAAAPISRQRYGLVVRRRSSAGAQIIPKFYHPFGKPNTYEIELQKKNIVACFDKFPDRKASLTAPGYRRHFHSIALACGFSEYFKEPLYLYVKHQMTQSNLLHSPTGRPSTRFHRQSGVGLDMVNGTNGSQAGKAHVPSSTVTSGVKRVPLARAASIDTSTMEKIQNQTFISCDQFLVCWREMIATAYDNPARFVHLLTLGQRNYLLPDDFVPMVQSIIHDHPGLEFLRAAPDFHMRYIQTVIARIYFNLNKSWTGKISLTELRQSNLLAVLQVLSQEDDINQVTDYFSYEHFYVIYCKFWTLDQDHDLLISKEDLARHNDAAISSRIIDRIFMGIVSKQIQKTGKMSYSDFVWFLIAEEDKKHPRSIEYWFRLMDIDGDGYISMYEMEYFYYEQMKRLELMNIEALPFVDSACQILDLVNPKEKNKISLADLKRTKMATIFFDTFINLEKYLEHESREFVSTRDVVQDGVVISDWDRYASEEYESLVTEESTV